MKKPMSSRSGQTLVVLLVFVTVAMAVTLISTLLTTYTIQQSSQGEQTALAAQMAETAMENALLRLLRDPSYTGEVLAFSYGSAVATVSGTTNKTITTEARVGTTVRRLSVSATYVNGVLTVGTWSDVW